MNMLIDLLRYLRDEWACRRAIRKKAKAMRKYLHDKHNHRGA